MLLAANRLADEHSWRHIKAFHDVGAALALWLSTVRIKRQLHTAKGRRGGASEFHLHSAEANEWASSQLVR